MDIFDRAATDRCLRRNHHLTPGILAVAEGEKQAAAVVALAICPQRERAAA